MNWDFKNAKELLELCSRNSLPISEVMIRREMQLGETTRESIMEQIDESLRVMNTSVDRAISEPIKSMGGLIGGEANKLRNLDPDKAICGPVIHRAIMSALAVSETNASMGVIVAAPTAGSSGVIPAVLLSMYESYDISIDALRSGLINAGAIGYIITRNGSVSGGNASVSVGGDLVINGALSGGQTSVSAGGSVMVNGSVSGNPTISAGSDVALGENGQVSGDTVVITARGDITQEEATIASSGGYVSDAKEIHDGVVANEITLESTDGSIGKASAGSSSYIGVTGSVTAKAAGDVAIAGAVGGDLDIHAI